MARAAFISSWAGEPRTWRMARVAREAGLEVLVVEWERVPSPPPPAVEGVLVLRYRRPAPSGFKLAKILPYVLFHWFALRALLRWRPEVVQFQLLINAPPALIYRLVRRRDCTLIFDISDPYCLSHVPKALFGAVRLVERIVAKAADVRLIPDPSRSSVLGRDLGYVVVYNSPLPEWVPRPPEAAPRGEAPVKPMGRLTVAYLGVLSEDRGLRCAIEAVRRVGGPVHLVIAGWGPMAGRVIEAARSTPNVEYLGLLAHRDAMRVMRGADVVLALYDPSNPNNVLAAPNKLYEALSLGKPLIVNDGTALSDLIREWGAGIVVPYCDAESLQSALRRLTDERLLGTLGDGAYSLWRHVYGRVSESYRRLKSVYEAAGVGHPGG